MNYTDINNAINNINCRIDDAIATITIIKRMKKRFTLENFNITISYLESTIINDHKLIYKLQTQFQTQLQTQLQTQRNDFSLDIGSICGNRDRGKN